MMEAGEAQIGSYYAGDYLTMVDNQAENVDLQFYYPENTNLFVDAMCIPASAQNKALAEEYINFMLSDEVAIANAEYICYSTPHTEALELLDPEVVNDPMFYPDEEVLDKTEVFITLDDKTLKLQKDLWIKLKCLRTRPSWWPFPS